jgi:hypothetical protein
MDQQMMPRRERSEKLPLGHTLGSKTFRDISTVEAYQEPLPFQMAVQHVARLYFSAKTDRTRRL